MSSERRVQTAAGALLLIWAVGVQLSEAIAALGMAGCAVVALIAFVRRPGTLREKLPAALRDWWPLWAFVVWALVGTRLGGEGPSGTGLARTADWLGVIAAAGCAAQVDARGLRRVAIAAFAVLVLSSVVAGLQHFGIWPAPEAFAPLRPFVKTAFQRVYEEVPGSPGRYMGGGLLFHRLKFSHVGGLVALFALAIALGPDPRVTKRERLLSGAVAAFAFGAILLFTYARAATAALLVAGILVALVLVRERRRALAGAVALAAVVLVLLALNAPLRERFRNSLTSQGSGDRDAILRTGTRAFAEHPIGGLGPGRFRPSRFALPETPRHVLENPGKAHNQLLSIAIETGVIGLALFVGLLAWLGWRAARASPLRRALTLGAIAHFLLLGVTHDPLFQAEYSMALVLALGLATPVRHEEREARLEGP